MKIGTTVLMGLFLLISACSKSEDNDLTESSCDAVSQIIDDNIFSSIDSTAYSITNIQVLENCLEITISSSGCDGSNWEMNLFSTDSFFNVSPRERTVKLELINNEECLAVFEKTQSFDLRPFQISSQDQVTLNIDGWGTQIIYEY